MAVYCAVAPDYKHFMAARILDGFFSTVAQAGGLVFIQDMFFFHEHVRLHHHACTQLLNCWNIVRIRPE